MPFIKITFLLVLFSAVSWAEEVGSNHLPQILTALINYEPITGFFPAVGTERITIMKVTSTPRKFETTFLVYPKPSSPNPLTVAERLPLAQVHFSRESIGEWDGNSRWENHFGIRGYPPLKKWIGTLGIGEKLNPVITLLNQLATTNATHLGLIEDIRTKTFLAFLDQWQGSIFASEEYYGLENLKWPEEGNWRHSVQRFSGKGMELLSVDWSDTATDSSAWNHSLSEFQTLHRVLAKLDERRKPDFADIKNLFHSLSPSTTCIASLLQAPDNIGPTDFQTLMQKLQLE